MSNCFDEDPRENDKCNYCPAATEIKILQEQINKLQKDNHAHCQDTGAEKLRLLELLIEANTIISVDASTNKNNETETNKQWLAKYKEVVED